jgi:membrane-associated phospholipid phosphatase
MWHNFFAAYTEVEGSVIHWSKTLTMATSLGKTVHRYFLEHDLFFNTSVDDRLRWIPFASVFLGEMFGVKSKSSWQRQVLLVGASEAIKYLISDNLKKIAQERRPAPYTGTHSFPSGHTCSSFAGAEFMRKEFKDSMPVLSYAGYVGATTVGIIRLMKNRHWVRDVVAGAAIGIISTQLAYLLINNLAKRRKKIKADKINEHATIKAMQFAGPSLEMNK